MQSGHFAHPFLSCKRPKSILVLDDCALALRDELLSSVLVISGERLGLGMSPVELTSPMTSTFSSNLKSLLEPGNLSRLSCGICYFIS